MAVTANLYPQLFHPLNAAVYKVTSSYPDAMAFRVRVVDDTTSEIISTQFYATLPMSPQSTTFDLAPMLSSVVDYEINTSPGLITELTKPLRRYHLIITEYYLTLAGRTEGATITTDDRFCFNAMLSRVDFAAYAYESYLIRSGFTGGRFLTNMPAISSVYLKSDNRLQFISTSAGSIRIRFYNRPGVLLTDHLEPYGDAPVYVLNLNVLDMQAVIPGMTLDFDYFTVQALNEGGFEISELRTFELKDYKCTAMVELVFGNNLGGFDSLMFTNPIQTIGTTKRKIDMSAWQLDQDGNYYDNANGVFNPITKVIGSKVNNSFSVVTEPLSQDMARFATGLIESENVFVKLSDGNLMPIEIDDSDYTPFNRNYGTKENRLTIRFKIPGVNFAL